MTKLEVIKHLRTLFPAQQFVVTGSTALVNLGLLPTGSDNDLDIILVSPTQSALETLERLQKDSPASTKPLSYGGNSTLKGIFMIEKIKVDVFVEENEIHGVLLTEEGFSITNCSWIVSKKKSQGRPKDWRQLFGMANKICTLSEFVTKMGGAF